MITSAAIFFPMYLPFFPVGCFSGSVAFSVTMVMVAASVQVPIFFFFNIHVLTGSFR